MKSMKYKVTYMNDVIPFLDKKQPLTKELFDELTIYKGEFFYNDMRLSIFIDAVKDKQFVVNYLFAQFKEDKYVTFLKTKTNLLDYSSAFSFKFSDFMLIIKNEEDIIREGFNQNTLANISAIDMTSMFEMFAFFKEYYDYIIEHDYYFVNYCSENSLDYPLAENQYCYVKDNRVMTVLQCEDNHIVFESDIKKQETHLEIIDGDFDVTNEVNNKSIQLHEDLELIFLNGIDDERNLFVKNYYSLFNGEKIYLTYGGN